MQEITLDIRLFHSKRGWEQRYFSQMLADNFFLLLRMDIWIKLGTIRGTFDQTAKMTVFLQHDMKNLVQLVSLAAEQVLDAEPGKEGKLLAVLAKSIPAIRDRAKHVLNSLVQTRTTRRRSVISLSDALQHTASLFDLTLRIQGDGVAHVSEEALLRIFENLIGNYAWQAKKEQAKVMDLVVTIVEHSTHVEIDMENRNGTPVPWPERLFEPFWSERGTGEALGFINHDNWPLRREGA